MPCSEDDDSQSGFMSEPPQGMSKAELRKTNKPIMEKKRRARINHCLNELKDLLMDAMDKDPTRHSKLEKADILELTVKHLQTLQRQQLAAAIAADPAVLHRFKAGFGDCAVEVRRYLSRLASVPTGLRHRLGNHLNTCLSGMQRLNPEFRDPPLVPDPLRLDDERPSAFHFVRSTKPHSPPLSPLSCDSACDSSTELETPPRPVQTFPFPTPPSRSASDQDSSPETQKPTVSSTTISPETLKQEALRNKKYMEPLSIVIDVENYKIGIDASPKRAVDYSMRNKLKRPVVDLMGPAPKVVRIEPERTVTIPERIPDHRERLSPEKSSAFRKVPERVPFQEKKFTLPESITTPNVAPARSMPFIRTVISHTAESLAQSSNVFVKEENSSAVVKKEEKIEPKTEADSSRAPAQGGSGASEMWRPW
ncbi:transcription factor HES-4-like [Pectinophora gossypiella]|uniref:transcription factor HES-4-like n=1 Tax=Pectinophora gossypiella TaxID=13191 RepID=UPI00214E1F56|nr:transcription factor HES-4-like [Pectinophora gossypiella]